MNGIEEIQWNDIITFIDTENEQVAVFAIDLIFWNLSNDLFRWS